MNFKKSFIVLTLVGAYFIATIPVFSAGRTSTVWKNKNTGGVTIIPYISPDKRSITIDFENIPSNTGYIYYNLNYTNKDNGIKDGIEGSFVPSAMKYSGFYNGVGYIRKKFLFGTCSGSRCIYHRPIDVTLTVNTQILHSSFGQYSQTLTFPNDQLGF